MRSFLSLSYGAYYTIKDIAMWDNFIIPASRFPGSTGISRHYTLHQSPATPPKNISGDTFRYRRWTRRLV
jgi:hypothetical protein